jgi:hypothetical protein
VTPWLAKFDREWEQAAGGLQIVSELLRQDARIEPCTPRRDQNCEYCGLVIARRYRAAQRFCSTKCRMRFHGRLKPTKEAARCT